MESAWNYKDSDIKYVFVRVPGSCFKLGWTTGCQQRWAECEIFQYESDSDSQKLNPIQSWSAKFWKLSVRPSPDPPMWNHVFYFASWGKIDTVFLAFPTFNMAIFILLSEAKALLFCLWRTRLIKLVKWQGWYCWNWKALTASAQSFTLWKQATIEITWQGHSILACLRHIDMGFIVCAHPVHGDSHIQRNVNREVARTSPPFYNGPHQLHILFVKAASGMNFPSEMSGLWNFSVRVQSCAQNFWKSSIRSRTDPPM